MNLLAVQPARATMERDSIAFDGAAWPPVGKRIERIARRLIGGGRRL